MRQQKRELSKTQRQLTRDQAALERQEKQLVKSVGHFGKYHNRLIVFVCPPKCCISIVSSFSWDLQWSQENKIQCFCKIWGHKQRLFSIMVYSEWPIDSLWHRETLKKLNFPNTRALNLSHISCKIEADWFL